MNETDSLISLDEARASIPGLEHRPPSKTTLRNWIKVGVGGVKLKSCRVGGRVYTSRAWLKEFLDATGKEAVK